MTPKPVVPPPGGCPPPIVSCAAPGAVLPGGAGSRADVARREGALQQELEIRALAVLHVIDVPGARGRILDPVHQADKAFRRIDVARLRRDHENGVDPFHRQHADDTAERAFALSLQHLLELAGELGGVAVADREEGIGLAGQNVDVEGADQTDQGLADRGIAADDQRIAPGSAVILPPSAT